MSEDTNALLKKIARHIEQGKIISAETAAALEKIQQHTQTDFSRAIEYLNQAEKDFLNSLENLGTYQQEAIRQVEYQFRKGYSNRPNWFNNLWNKLVQR